MLRTGKTFSLYHAGSPKCTSAAIGTKRYKANLKTSRLGPAIATLEKDSKQAQNKNSGTSARSYDRYVQCTVQPWYNGFWEKLHIMSNRAR